MKKLIGISAMVLLAGIVGSAAQSPAQQGPVQQGGAAPNNQGQQVTPSPAVSNVPKPKAGNSGPPYSDCYMKCVNAGNPGDYCKNNANSYCY